ncbi:MAG: bifunctional glutamate N-acetyltransferase/amino-acid acetyltransferase ArgJ [Oscillospiraceae bacterium]|jgi:glutamate N-acetyltransferase/amino-acid N-acetyltransferase|nr:bifunctional glutamate N-acetyltransferase/amino-acid acetyltransferase ArgJ [Oscillospiraceae bacterium]
MMIAFKGFEFVEGGVCAPEGFQASGVHCGLRRNRNKPDLALIYSPVPCKAAAVYTQNKVKGAPLQVTKEHLAAGDIQAVIVNSGNANTCNPDGEEKARAMCGLIARELEIPETAVAVASTGVIGEVLPLEPIESACPQLKKELSPEGNDQAALAIMTTDTVKKEVAVTFQLGGKTCRLGGMAKGSGMIHPNMATMLCFLTTDAALEPRLLQLALSAVTGDTFNMVSVDGDTSTNDMVLLMASGQAGNPVIRNPASEDYKTFQDALYAVMMNLSREIARDGEGASKLLECMVSGAADEASAKVVAKSVITSSLFKSAMFGEDANWGRILCAVGYAQAELDPEQVEVTLKSQNGKVLVCRKGRGVPFSEEVAKEVLRAGEIQILIRLGDGEGKAVAWGCDLTYDYVKINGSYRT